MFNGIFMIVMMIIVGALYHLFIFILYVSSSFDCVPRTCCRYIRIGGGRGDQGQEWEVQKRRIGLSPAATEPRTPNLGRLDSLGWLV